MQRITSSLNRIERALETLETALAHSKPILQGTLFADLEKHVTTSSAPSSSSLDSCLSDLGSGHDQHLRRAAIEILTEFDQLLSDNSDG